MRTAPRLLPEIDGFPGWSWRALDQDDLPLAGPLARLADITPDLTAWLALAGRWLACAAIEGGALGALLNPGGGCSSASSGTGRAWWTASRPSSSTGTGPSR